MRAVLLVIAAGVAVCGLTATASGSYIYVKAELAQVLLQRAWQKSLDTGSEQPPWPWADTWPVARVQGPRSDRSTIVLAGAEGASLAFGPAWLRGSAFPGDKGMTVLAGHRDTHFEFLQQLTVGDELLLETLHHGVKRYRVQQIEIIDSTSAQIAIDHQYDTLVLVTCFPFDSLDTGSPLRWVVAAHEV